MAKILTVRLGWVIALLYIALGSFSVFLFFCLPNVALSLGKFHLLGLLCGTLAGMGSVAFYKGLEIAPANVIIPSSSLYVIFTVTFSIVFLHEPIVLRRIIGLLLGIAAVILSSA